jgi:hypothetical protein
VLSSCRCQDVAVLIDYHGARSTGADIDAYCFHLILLVEERFININQRIAERSFGKEFRVIS